MKIKDYALSPPAKLTDKIICSDGDTNATKNITINELLSLDPSGGVEIYYNAIATQTSTNAPVFTTLNLNPMGIIVWIYAGSPGDYIGTLAGAFTGIPVLIYGANGAGTRGIEVSISKFNDDVIKMKTTLNGADADGLLTNTWMKIINVI